MAELFQSSLFGYSKKSVCAYIAEMNEGFSQRLLEKDAECKRVTGELTAQLEQLRRENEELRAGRQEVAGALIDAKSFAAGLMERAAEEDRARRARSEACHAAELQRLQELAAGVDTLRGAIRAALSKMDEELEEYGVKCQAAQAKFYWDAPEPAADGAEAEAEA